MRENASQKNPPRIQERNHTLQKTNRYIAAWYYKAFFFLDFFASNGLLSIPLVIAVKEKKKGEKKQQKQKKHTKKDNWE